MWEEPLHTLFCLAQDVCLAHFTPGAHRRQYRCPPEVTYESDKKQFFGGTYREGENRKTLQLTFVFKKKMLSNEVALFLQQNTSWHAWRLRREKGRSRQLCPSQQMIMLCCVPRYGLPVNFQAMLLQPNRKSVKRLRDVLNVVFKHLDEVAAASIMDVCIWTASA